MIVKRITITSDLRVMVRRATNNLRPLDFRYGEVESLTELLRTKGRPALERELLSLFFYGTWQGRSRYSRAVGYALFTDNVDKYEAWRLCQEDKAYERHLLRKYPLIPTLWMIFEDSTFAFRSGDKHRSRRIYGK